MRHFLIVLGLAAACAGRGQDAASFVDPFIGTAGHGHTHPAALVPHGMVQPGPDTRHHGWDACSGYHFTDTTVNGFSQTRLSGTGCGDLSDFLLMPTTGRQDVGHQGEKGGKYRCAWASPFSHSREHAEPGYYSVHLDRYGIQAEMTAAAHTAIYRFTYERQDSAGVIVDLDYNNQNQWMEEMRYRRSGDRGLFLFHRSHGWAYHTPTYAYVEFSMPFDMEAVRDTVRENGRDYPCCKLLVRFKDGAASYPILAKVALSYVDDEGAYDNLKTEIFSWDFDAVRSEARRLWNEELAAISIDELGAAAADSTRQIFYTALYHAHIAPALFSDVDGRYLGMDHQIHVTPQDDPVYHVFSLWDTHRALHPLLSIVEPQRNEAFVRTLIRKGDELGIVPKWELTAAETGCMIGYHYAALLADTYAKGHRNYDLQRAYRHALRAAEADTAGLSPAMPRWKMEEAVPVARRLKNALGYIPCDETAESVAKGLEYAYNDWCIARLAAQLGTPEEQRLYSQRAGYYRNYFDPATRFMRGRTRNGGWRTPFDPLRSDHRTHDYTEGTAWQWAWFVPHDPQGLIRLMGGRRAFVSKLDSLFVQPARVTGDNVSPDISGMVGQYAHGNEPSHHIIHLYNYARRPDRTQELADSVLRTLYTTGPDGLCGNEDCGQMSAWYVLNAMGFYQVCPGEPVYSIGRPLFGRVTIHLPSGRTFTIRTTGNSPSAKYVRAARLNGKRLRKPFFTHAQLEAGGVLELQMGTTPR